ncbi:XAC2610-related protein [Psychrobacter sp. 1U2]|uniref:XAC2610-related protein n=1 Tax=Psychrobacter sp. 1U2 TaxID=3453577 RepID=UPI003F4521E2
MSSNILSKVLFKRAVRATTIASGLLVFASILPALAQASNQHYQVQEFSDDYSASITAIEDEDSESNSIINVINAKTGQTLISQPASLDIEYELDNSKARQLGEKISANIANRHYGEHSVLIYDDFNFDDQKDLALRDGRNGCYGGPSYQVYLKEDNTFVHSDGFTELAQGYCGFFDIDKDSEILSTMSKSGAAWHQFKEFKVINDEPVVVRIIEEEWNNRSLLSITESKKINGKMKVENYEMLPPYAEQAENPLPYIYMLIVDNNKKMVLDSQYKDGSEQLYYAFADEEGRIELLYEGQFDYDKTKKTLSFTNRPVLYKINNQGITVKLPNKTVQLKAQPKSVFGSLDGVAQFKNVRVK